MTKYTKEYVIDWMESFGIKASEQIYREYEDSIEDKEALIEWLEKTDGNFGRAVELHGITQRLPTTEETVENLASWYDWKRLDPNKPPEFNCPACGDHYFQVETRNGESAVDSTTGEISDLHYCGDSLSTPYNFGMGTGKGYHSNKMCGYCYEQTISGREAHRLRAFFDGGFGEFNYQKTVAYDSGYSWPEATMLQELPGDIPDAVKSIIGGDGVPDEWVKVKTRQDYDSAFVRRAFDMWIDDQARDNEFNTGKQEWPFDFQCIVVSRYVSRSTRGTILVRKDNEEALEEARSWLTPKRLRRWRKENRMR